MATTDLHVHVHPYDYYADQPDQTLGLARTAGLIETLRAGAVNTLLLDNGDFLQGSPMGDYIAEVRGMRPGDIHPMIAAMNALGYDAAGLGNHEFNYGLDFLLASLAGARFPVVSANVVTQAGLAPGSDQTLLPPYVILDRQLTDGAGLRHRIRIGVIGLLPPQTMIWDRTHLTGRVITRDIVATAVARVPQMRAAGADLIVALCHSGIGPAESHERMENAALALAALPGIDALIVGHSHLVFPGPGWTAHPDVDARQGILAGKPAVMAGCFGSHLGLIDLLLDRTTDGWRVAGSTAQARPVTTLAPTQPATGLAAAVMDATLADHEATLDHIRRPVGRATVPLNSYFAVLPGNPVLALVALAQREHVERALRGTEFSGLPLLSAASPFKMGGRGGPGYYTDMPAGDLALRNVADLYVYPNTICAVQITGAELQDWLERAAGLFNQLRPGKPDQPLIDLDVPASHFDVIDGVTWAIDLSEPSKFGPEGAVVAPRARRIRDLCHAGRAVVPTDRFIVATNSYRAGGGAAFPGAGGDTVIYAGRQTTRDILRNYIAEIGTIDPSADPTWRFHPLPGTSALFDTSPRAIHHLPVAAGLAIERAGTAPCGLARFRIHM